MTWLSLQIPMGMHSTTLCKTTISKVGSQKQQQCWVLNSQSARSCRIPSDCSIWNRYHVLSWVYSCGVLLAFSCIEDCITMNAISIDRTNITIGSECVQVYMSTAVLLCGCMYCLGTYILAIQVIIWLNCIVGQVVVQHWVPLQESLKVALEFLDFEAVSSLQVRFQGSTADICIWDFMKCLWA